MAGVSESQLLGWVMRLQLMRLLHQHTNTFLTIYSGWHALDIKMDVSIRTL